MKSPNQQQIGPLAIHDMTFADCLEWIATALDENRAATVCTPNADYIVRSRRDRSFLGALQKCDLRVPDGMAIIYASRLAGRPLRGTVTGRRLIPTLAQIAADRGYAVVLFGAQDGVAARAADRLSYLYPGLKVTGVSPPTPFVVGSPADREAVRELRQLDPRIIFVGLGAPKQEAWLVTHAHDFPRAVLIGIGAGLDIVAGRFREAPRWMTHVGLEWLYRLVQEPRRLARRYLIDDPWIFWWALRVRSRRTWQGRDGR